MKKVKATMDFRSRSHWPHWSAQSQAPRILELTFHLVQGRQHQIGVLFPQSSAALDVGEQEGDRPTRPRYGRVRGRLCGGTHSPLGWRRGFWQVGGREDRQRGWDVVQPEAGELHEGRLLVGRELQMLCEALGSLARGALLVGLDFADADHRAADQPRQPLLGQVERFAPPLEPRAE
jgi:hypothetical protein